MSLRLRILNAILRALVRPLLARTRSPSVARASLRWITRIFLRRAQGVTVRSVTLGTCRALEFVPPGTGTPDALILYLHGGGYVAGSPETHAPLLTHLAKETGIPILAPDYRLAPEHPFPAAFEDAVACWEAVLARGARPENVILGGDSAGGGLALALLAEVLAHGQRPAGLFALSPWTDLTGAGGSVSSNAGADVLLPAARMDELVQLVLSGLPPDDPRASPLFAEFATPPPVFIQVGATEILRDDGLRIAERLSSEGATVTVDLWPDTPHVLAMFPRWLPEARTALDRIAAFCRACITPPAAPGES